MITDEAMLRDGAARLAALLDADRRRPRRILPLASPRSRQVVDKSEGVSEKRQENRKPAVFDSERLGVVAWDGIEPPTRGFSVPPGHKIQEDEKG
jgi:hypothetical protein